MGRVEVEETLRLDAPRGRKRLRGSCPDPVDAEQGRLIHDGWAAPLGREVPPPVALSTPLSSQLPERSSWASLLFAAVIVVKDPSGERFVSRWRAIDQSLAL